MILGRLGAGREVRGLSVSKLRERQDCNGILTACEHGWMYDILFVSRVASDSLTSRFRFLRYLTSILEPDSGVIGRHLLSWNSLPSPQPPSEIWP